VVVKQQYESAVYVRQICCENSKMAFLRYHPLIHSEYTCVLLISNIQVISVITLLVFGVKIPNGSVYFFHSILWGKFTEIF
jgi:hypothetical protein